MSIRFAFFIFVAASVALIGCGGAATVPAAEPAFDDSAASKPRPTLARADLTTAVDEESMRATVPAATEFLPETPQIFLVGTLIDLPADAEIEVRWIKVKGSEPIHVSRITASGTRTFLSRLLPPAKSFSDGRYQALVYVNDTEVGGVSFSIADRRSGGRMRVKDLVVTESVEVRTSKAIKPASSFRKGIKKVFASFFVSGLESGATIRVLWYRGGKLISENDIESKGDKRYAVVLDKRKGLRGDYAVEVEVDGEVFAGRSFFVGGDNIGPAIDRAALGATLGRNRMPKRVKTIFKRNARAIGCGVRFLDLPEDSKIEIQWVSLKDDQEQLLHATDSEIPKGGSSTVGMTWNPGGDLSPGPYKAVISVNGRKMEELPFTVK